MFDLEVFLVPAIVAAAMLIAWIGFAVWGSRAIRVSALRAEMTPKPAPPEEALAPTVEAETAAEEELTLLTPAPELERTTEFAQPSFAQSFLDGEEIDPAKVDYNAAIDRITAGLDAAAAAAEEAPAADMAVAEAMQAAAAEEPAAEEPAAEEPAAEDTAADAPAVEEPAAENTADNTAETAAPAAVDEDDIEATRLLQVDKLAEEPAAEAADMPPAEEVPAAPGEDIEATRVIGPAAAAEAAAAATAGAALGKAELEETLLLNQVRHTSKTSLPRFGEGAENEPHRMDSLFPEQPLPFGPKMAWLAVPGYQPSEVIAALRLAQVEPANWTKGLTEAYADNDRVFVSPTLSGWVLVVGRTLWQKADMNRSAENIQWLKDVGRLFGNACFFSTMRGLGNNGWVGIRGGQIVRAYGYSGELQELIWLVGEPTDEEIAVNPAFVTETEERRLPDFRPIIPDEKMVLAMAAAWSVDVTFSHRSYPPDFGFLGSL